MPNRTVPTFTNLNMRPLRTVTWVDQFRVDVERAVTRAAPVEVDALFEGGGTLGAAYVGSLTLLESAGVQFKRIAGISAGAITAALVAAGYKANEIEWLMSNFNNRRVPKPSSLNNINNAIDFMDFLDLPTVNSVSRGKRKTMLWKLLKGEIIDHLLNEPLPVPRRSETINKIIASFKNNLVINAVMSFPGMEAAMKTVLGVALVFLPNRAPRLKDFNPFDTEALRIRFADRVWDLIAKINPLLVVMTQFTYEGSIFEGDAFLNTMNQLLSAKLADGGPVLFQNLPIPLAVISQNYATGQVVVYSSHTHPRMSVAEAVRRSMSLPLIFQPRKVDPHNRGGEDTDTMIDGGWGSNFPIWLFNPAGDKYWPPASISASRVKMGLSLNKNIAAPQSWNVNPAKFNLGNDGQVDPVEVIKTMFVSRFKELNMFTPSSDNTEARLNLEIKSWKFMEVLFGFVFSDKEEAAREQLRSSIMNGKNYFDISIPLLGFHGFDFSINGNREDMDAIAERGFAAALDALQKAPMTGTVAPLIRNAAAFPNPYH